MSEWLVSVIAFLCSVIMLAVLRVLFLVLSKDDFTLDVKGLGISIFISISPKGGRDNEEN